MTKKNVPEVLYTRLVPEGDCLLYTGRLDAKGYGRLSLAGRTISAHRLAFILAYGAIPRGKHVLHSCDRPACCNPKHLRAGSNRENVDDMLARGRSRAGARHPRSKLNAEEVSQIRAVSGASHKQLGRLYGVGWRAIQKIVKLQRWSR